MDDSKKKPFEDLKKVVKTSIAASNAAVDAMNAIGEFGIVSKEEIIEQCLNAFTSSDVLTKDVLGHLEKCVNVQYASEINKATTEEERQTLIQQCINKVWEDINIEDIIIEQLRTCGLDELETHMTKIQDSTLENQKRNDILMSEIDSLKKYFTDSQVKLFGRVIYPLESLEDNDIVEIVEEMSTDAKSKSKMTSSSMTDGDGSEKTSYDDEEKVTHVEMSTEEDKGRMVSPGELIQGLRGEIYMPVLAKYGRDLWHPGRIESIENGDKSSDQRRYRVSLDGKSAVKVLTAFQVARTISALDAKEIYPVGTRIVSIYRDDQGGLGYYSGVVAEPPSVRNNKRYLLFFDDGYTQYSGKNEIYRIFHQSQENWKELSDESQEFVKKYLEQYPERPMVRMRVNQVIRTELNGNWLPATVEHVDASLVLMHFAENHREWIYRGSTRLEPLYTEMMLASESRGRNRTARHHTGGAGMAHNRAVVEYTNQDDELANKKRSMARKSTAKLRDDPASRPLEVANADLSESENLGTLVSTLDSVIENRINKLFVPHKCDPTCLQIEGATAEDGDLDNPVTHKSWNPLEVPILAGWSRLRGITTARGMRDIVCYTAPCGRQLRTFNDVERYLVESDSKLSVDLFCFDPQVKINVEFKALKTLTHIGDMSYGFENVPIACVNSVDNDVPVFIDYLPVRSATDSVPLNEDPDYLVCCDCTDNCRNKSKCACQQLTVEASTCTNPRGQPDLRAGYIHRRLHNFTVGGLYECNSRCKCDRRCRNRVVQHGIWAKLQIFKTERKGWGIRALHSIPKGAFVCIYAGAIFDETTAVSEGHQYGDEYQAELDYIESVERSKEGYESDVEESESEPGFEDADEEEQVGESVAAVDTVPTADLDDIVGKESDEDSPSSDESGPTSNRLWLPTSVGLEGSERRTNPSRQAKSRRQKEKALEKARDKMRKRKKEKAESADPKAYIGRLMPSPKKKDGTIADPHFEEETERPVKSSKSGGRRSTGGNLASRRGDDSEVSKSRGKPRLSIRDYYGDDNPFVMDAKKSGNLGRYFNHSCSPNVFVQNVFINTHDLRFPEVAFFAKRNIDAGEEMTWDYNYQVGSVPGKVLYCYCGSSDCRGRLL